MNINENAQFVLLTILWSTNKSEFLLSILFEDKIIKKLLLFRFCLTTLILTSACRLVLMTLFIRGFQIACHKRVEQLGKPCSHSLDLCEGPESFKFTLQFIVYICAKMENMYSQKHPQADLDVSVVVYIKNSQNARLISINFFFKGYYSRERLYNSPRWVEIGEQVIKLNAQNAF